MYPDAPSFSLHVQLTSRPAHCVCPQLHHHCAGLASAHLAYPQWRLREPLKQPDGVAPWVRILQWLSVTLQIKSKPHILMLSCSSSMWIGTWFSFQLITYPHLFYHNREEILNFLNSAKQSGVSVSALLFTLNGLPGRMTFLAFHILSWITIC